MTTQYPWEQPHLRDDVTRILSVRLPEKLAIKLQWLSLQTSKSQQRYATEVLIPHIEAEVQKLLDQEQ